MNYYDIKMMVAEIKKKITCPKCKGHYTDEDIDIVSSFCFCQSVFYATCFECQLDSVIEITIDFNKIKPKIQKLGTAPRLGKISSNEVLDMRNFLQNFDGNFSGIFKNKDKKTS